MSNKQHEAAIVVLEGLRARVGDENFIKFMIGIVKFATKRTETPLKIAEMCVNCPKLLYSYLRMYINDIRRKAKDESVDIDDNLNGWMLALGEDRLDNRKGL